MLNEAMTQFYQQGSATLVHATGHVEFMFQRVTFASRARLGNGKNANFCLLCSTKTKVDYQAPTEQNAWPDLDFCDKNSLNWRLTAQYSTVMYDASGYRRAA